jgi:hypothetical protein
VVVVSSESAEHKPKWRDAGHVPVAELARRQDVRPIGSVDDLARPEAFESDEELDEFLADLYASRHAGSWRPGLWPVRPHPGSQAAAARSASSPGAGMRPASRLYSASYVAPDLRRVPGRWLRA